MHRGYELTSLYQATPQLFSIQKSKSFARFLQALTLHENLIAHTFFRQLWMSLNTCIPHPSTEPPHIDSYSSSKDEEVDTVGLEARRAVSTASSSESEWMMTRGGSVGGGGIQVLGSNQSCRKKV